MQVAEFALARISHELFEFAIDSRFLRDFSGHAGNSVKIRCDRAKIDVV
jgi:hypothetical protein